MILKNKLYNIVSENVDEKSFNLELIPDCVIYRAHFPEQPITPGVCIIQIASELFTHLMNHHVELGSISNAKFLAVINPTETKNLTYKFNKIIPDEATGSCKVSVVVTNSDTTFTKLSLVYKTI